ncbi:biliverdin-producing heme oxygenase [Falsiroseomonas bella]|uniref:Biliverdin-producing heme oxygenase n=1 Tax=Falsiroseomonas bella TaxID=2184016 RepID=A0A317FKG6_9PROT|nr:biliverdin-producing heme oxygenase [Falsiroseomonas bella]PWS39053.1 biliverdin-producing heme oxygenase [Falsiroseomonas bella]
MDGAARAALRAATDAAHQRLHGLPGFVALAEGRIALPDYAVLLRRMLGFHAALESRLDAVEGLDTLGIDLAARRRTHLLRADLDWLGASAAVPLAPLPEIRGPAEAMGALYVAEGSTLGARQLARALDAVLPPGEAGRRFLIGHGERHGAMWRDCCAAIERCGVEPGARDAMIAGAAATFAAFEAWFTVPEAVPAA